MTKFEIYTTLLCLIVFVMLAGVFSYMLAVMLSQEIRLINAGLEDERIVKEFKKRRTQKQEQFRKTLNIISNIIFAVIFGTIFAFTLYINGTENVYFHNLPTYKVVLTTSMETKNGVNNYLYENNLDDQIAAFDLILTYKVPDEYELELYDIVVYEVDGNFVVHRIVGIEEPNANHPNERYFTLQGDAVSSPDRYPVRYSQIKAIYKGEKVPFLGSFVLFMQSPAGWLCLFFVLAACVVMPLLKKKLLNVKKERYDFLYWIG